VSVLKLAPEPRLADEIKERSVALLRDALVEAEAGRICGVVIVSKWDDGQWSHRATRSLSIRETIGALEVVKLEIADQARGP
jgi:hypothetical protein